MAMLKSNPSSFSTPRGQILSKKIEKSKNRTTSSKTLALSPFFSGDHFHDCWVRISIASASLRQLHLESHKKDIQSHSIILGPPKNHPHCCSRRLTRTDSHPLSDILIVESLQSISPRRHNEPCLLLCCCNVACNDSYESWS